jgi:thiol-disulfide isomerase/thioredoxin
MKYKLITLLAVTLLGALGYLWFAPAGLKNSPDISVTGIDGKQLNLSDYRGRPLLVTFWATTCPGCIKEMPHLIELYKELSPQGLEIIAIAMDYDPPNLVLAMHKARQIPYPVALDLNADAARAFGNVRLTPTSFLIAPDGHIVFRRIGEMNMDQLRRDILGILQQAARAETRVQQARLPA